MMRCEWVLIVGAGLCVSLVPACQLVVRQVPPNELPGSANVNREHATDQPRTGIAAGSPYHPVSPDEAGKPNVAKEIVVAQARYPVVPQLEFGNEGMSPDLIPQPPTLAEAFAPAKSAAPAERRTAVASPPDDKAPPREDPPLIEALRYMLAKQPAEALARLDRYDKSSQELLLCLLPLAVRLTEGGLQQCDRRETTAVVDQLDRMAASLRPRAELLIKKMCFCSRIEQYGYYVPISEGHGFQPGDWVLVYVELQNLSTQRHGSAYGIYLASTVEIRDFNGQGGWRRSFPDRFDLSQSERQDFYIYDMFRVPKIPAGLYTLHLQVTDVPTGRTAVRTLDFRVLPAYGRGDW